MAIVDVFFCVSVGVNVEDESFEVLAVEGDDVLVDELPFHRVHPPRVPFFLLPRENVVLHLLPNHLHQPTIIRFLYDGVGQC